MSVYNLAQHVKAHGRGNDTELVHVTPKELAGLNALASASGKTPSRNPHTGFQEFGIFDGMFGGGGGGGGGFLDQVIPAIAAGAAIYFTAGAAAPEIAAALSVSEGTAGMMAGAGAGALINGGVAAAQGKSGSDVLNSSLMGGVAGGIGGYMGAGSGAAGVDGAPVETGMVDTPMEGTGAPPPPSAPAGTISSAPQGLTPEQTASGIGNPNGFTQTPGGAPQGLSPQEMMAGSGNQVGFTQSPGAIASKAVDNGQWINGVPNFVTGAGGIAALTALSQPHGGGPTGPTPYVNKSTLSPNFQGSFPAQPNPPYKATYPHYAKGGLADLQGHVGLLNGAGDGVSDSIHATINGSEPARLADGEFVVPARIVSELGNGSTGAGAKQLYAMMDRVSQKSRSNKHPAVDSKAYKALPA